MTVANSKRTLSIRVRLMILAVIAVVPLLLDRIHDEETGRNERIEVAYKQALGLAQQAAATQNEAIVSVRAVLQAVASARTTFNTSYEQCSEFVSKIAKPIPWIRTLSVANLQGQIICSSFPDAIGLDISARQHFVRAIDSGDFVLSDYFMASVIKAPVITAALAQTGQNGGAAAVVLGVLDLNWFRQIAKTFVTQSGGMLMIDGVGTVLAQYPHREDQAGRQFNEHPLIREMLSHSEGVITATALDGVRRVFGYVQLPGTQTRFAVGFDESEVLARVNRAMVAAFTELGLITCLVLLGIWFGAERLLIRPIRALVATTERIGHGATATPAEGVSLAAEFVPLVAAIDDMAKKLDAREQELRDRNSQLHQLAHTDALTGLANRRTFNERLVSDWQTAAKLRQPIAVLMVDVDHFKRFNDQYGHVQGDGCLRKVGGVLMAATRTNVGSIEPGLGTDLPPSFQKLAPLGRNSDFAARYGGEEFAILLQGTDLESAVQVAERLRKGVEDLLMAHIGAPWGFVSISIGAAAMMPGANERPQDLTERADAALYEAKKRGRNRVVAHAAFALSKVG